MGVSTNGTRFLQRVIGCPSPSLSSLEIGPFPFPSEKKDGPNIGLGVNDPCYASCLGGPVGTTSFSVLSTKDGPVIGIGADISISTHLAIRLISSSSSSSSDDNCKSKTEIRLKLSIGSSSSLDIMMTS